MNDTPKMPYTCATCRWHVAGRKLSTGQLLAGQCRRNPPTFTPGGSRWPATEAHEWCGEHHRLWEETQVAGPSIKEQAEALMRRYTEKHLTTEHTPGATRAGQTGEPAETDSAGNSASAEDGNSSSEVKPAAGSPASGPLTSPGRAGSKPARGRREV